MKALTLWQPWASLVGFGDKTIETRSWPTLYRGPLAIHAAKRHLRETDFAENLNAIDTAFHRRQMCVVDDLPLGMVIATCSLADVVLMVDASGCKDATKHLCIVNESMLLHSPLGQPWPDGQTEHIVSDQRPYGDFQPGRYAWLLENVQKIDDPIPAVGHQGLWNWEAP